MRRTPFTAAEQQEFDWLDRFRREEFLTSSEADDTSKRTTEVLFKAFQEKVAQTEVDTPAYYQAQHDLLTFLRNMKTEYDKQVALAEGRRKALAEQRAEEEIRRQEALAEQQKKQAERVTLTEKKTSAQKVLCGSKVLMGVGYGIAGLSAVSLATVLLPTVLSVLSLPAAPVLSGLGALSGAAAYALPAAVLLVGVIALALAVFATTEVNKHTSSLKTLSMAEATSATPSTLTADV